MELDPQATAPRELYAHMVRLITPRPIAWVSSLSPAGVANLAPYSYFNAVGSKPPLLMFCPANRADGGKKDSLANIEATGEFVVNIVSFEQAAAMNQSSANYEPAESEFEACGLTPAPASHVRPPRVAEARAHFECRLHTAMQLGVGPGGANLVIGSIVAMQIADEVLGEDGYADPQRLDTVGRMGGVGYVRTTERFDMPRPTLPD